MTSLHLTKVKSMQMAGIRSALQRRPTGKFSVGLSPEAQKAMQEVADETKEQERITKRNKRGKRGSRGNVLFSDTVHARQLGAEDTQTEDAYSDFTYTLHVTEMLGGEEEEGRSRRDIHRWLDGRGGNSDPVDIVQSVNNVEEDFEVEREARREGRDPT